MLQQGYYRIISNEYNRNLIIGDLVFVLETRNGVYVLIGESHTIYSQDDMQQFASEFEYAPNGNAERQQEISDLMSAVINGNNDKLLEFNIGIPQEAHDSTGLTIDNNAQTIKHQIAESRNNIARVQQDIIIKNRQLKMLLAEQSNILRIKSEELSSMVKRAEEAIWTINLYLGKNEEIVVLSKGEPAPAEQKISIRQTVLFMDEECAINPDDDGIDVRDIAEFDKWIIDPKHIQQVIPEDKAIVALHVRRSRRDYDDPWVNAQLNDANINWTYFLIRNGKNLYRVFVDITVGTHMFPTSKEYTDLFVSHETDYNDPNRPTIDVEVKPGSRAYMKAMEASNAKDKHYLRIVLILQGILDRTPIFKPMPVDRINICNPSGCFEYVQFIYDGELTLGDGRPKFDEWLKDINSKLNVGDRIIGNLTYDNLSGSKYTSSRLSHSECPEKLKLYTIEKFENDRLIILYERFRNVSSPRARCELRHTDNFILNFDAAKVEDLQYYLSSRTSRHLYMSMIPVINTAIKMKQVEKTTEEPFRLLLIGQIMRRFGTSATEVESQIDELIKWWKFKNRTHRALTSDDQKALHMIVLEYELRTKNNNIRNKASRHNGEIIKTITDINGDKTILIAHKSGNKYVAYVAHNNVNVWVCEQTWTHNRVTNAITLFDSKDWKTVDNRHMRWEIIYNHDRWNTWIINPKPSQILTDSELNDAVEYALCRLEKERVRDEEEFNNGDYGIYMTFNKRQKQKPRVLPLYAIYEITNEGRFIVTMWYSDSEPISPTELLLSNYPKEPSLNKTEITWERKVGGIKFRKSHSSGSYDFNMAAWITHDNFDYTIRRWDNNITQIINEFARHKELINIVNEVRDRYDYVCRAVSKLDVCNRTSEARIEYDKEYGAPDLWDEHLEKLKIRGVYFNSLRLDLEACSERNINVVGMTLGELHSLSSKFINHSSCEYREYFDFTIPLKPENEFDDD